MAVSDPIPRSQYHPQTDYESKTHAILDRLLEESRLDDGMIRPEWDENLDYARGRQWRVPRPQGFSMVTNNIIWRIMQQTAALVTDTRPTFEITSRPNDPLWTMLNQEINKTTDAILFQNEISRKLVRIVYDLFITTLGYTKTYWDPFAAWGLGDVVVDRVNPKYVRRDRNADSLKESNYICYRAPITLMDIQRRFPLEKAMMVQQDDGLSTFAITERHQFSITGPRPRNKRGKPYESAMPRSWIEEWLIRDPAVNEDGTARYPAGRLITRSGTPPVILQDIAYPYWDPWPGFWSEFSLNHIDDGPYGDSDITQLKTLQDAVNVMTSLMVDNARLMNNGIWLIEQDALEPQERDKLMSRPGQIVEYHPGKQIRRDLGQAMPSGWTQLLSMLIQFMQFVSGIQDTGMGKAGGGVTAQGALEILQMATQATIRLKSREVEAGMSSTGQRVVARIFQFYKQNRIMDVLGEEGIQTFTWSPKALALAKVSQQRQAAVVGPDADQDTPFLPKLLDRDHDDDDGDDIDLEKLRADIATIGDLDDDDRNELVKQFRVRIQPGSSLALSKERKWAMELGLYAQKLIDRKAVLDSIDYPNKDEIERRMQQQEMMVAVAQAAASQGKGKRGSRAGDRPRARGMTLNQKVS